MPQQISLLLTSPSNRKMLHQFLQELGHSVVLANRIEDGPEDQNLLILDDQSAMRHKDSLRKLKRRRYLLPVLLVTRQPSAGALGCLRQGLIDDILCMPTSKPELTSRLDVLLRLSSQSRTALRKFERLFEDASWGILVLHPRDYYIEAANRAFARMQGVASQDLTGQDFRWLVAPEWRRQLETDLQRLGRARSLLFQTELWNSQKQRSYPVEIDATVYRDNRQVPLYVAAYVRDITERMRAEKALIDKNLLLEEATRQARQASQAKSHFLANINHELRTPLHGVLATLSLLAETPLSPLQRDQVNLIQHSADALFELVGDILDFTTLESGECQLQPVPFHCERLAELIPAELRSRAQSKGLSFRMEIKNAPRQDLLLDPVRLRQILAHLVGNAIKFTSTGSIEVCLDFPAEKQSLLCQVRDTGIGVPPQKLETIFEFFTQADASTTRRFDGIGLGLSLCARFLELMGGRLGMESQPGQGSLFFFEIPIQLIADPSRLEDGGDATVARPLKVLVVEDNPVNQQVMKLLLRELGHQPEIASDGGEGLRLFEQQRFDLILMDLQMPDLSGLDVTRLIRKTEAQSGQPQTPIVAITARALPNGRQECLQAGMDEYLTKPVSIHQLHDLIEQLFS